MGPLTRLDGWEERLVRYIEHSRAIPFRWGEHDCATFAAGAVAAITGTDHFESFRGKYADEESAASIVAERAEGEYERLITGILGEPKPIGSAGRGDIVLSLRYRLPTLGVCLGEQSAFVTKKGLTFAQTLDSELAWTI